MNFKQTVLSFFPWVKSNSESNPEPPAAAPEANPTPQPPVTMSFYAVRSRRIPGRRSPAGSR
ncbi:hypothetical protein H6F90_09615 [Trichocoleus sp. FACHB-591]|uniref:hypothetical protein n=1 Tax=Trichocoleus TaxID=450526 RepID=UPI0016886905|nr:hypothetical protein [Trichocoleus sp. FACHB-591]MBD2095414.1 hypothetical protein [Trichocoleus sp. FACHB-591]